MSDHHEIAAKAIETGLELTRVATSIVDRLEITEHALSLAYTVLQTATAYRGYPKTGPLSEPATEAALRAADAVLRRAGR